MRDSKAFTLQSLKTENLHKAIALLKLYGQYMYEELLLTAGSVNLYDELKGDLFLKRYQPPGGYLILAYAEEKAVGCVALKKWNKKACEMKRMFVLPEYRRLGLGKLLAKAVLQQAEKFGYREVLLDTNKEMDAAIALYRSLGFTETDPYCLNENKHVVYMKKVLTVDVL